MVIFVLKNELVSAVWCNLQLSEGAIFILCKTTIYLPLKQSKDLKFCRVLWEATKTWPKVYINQAQLFINKYWHCQHNSTNDGQIVEPRNILVIWLS